MVQPTLFSSTDIGKELLRFLEDLLESPQLPSAHELVDLIESSVGIDARYKLLDCVQRLSTSPDLNRFQRQYLLNLMSEGELLDALRGGVGPGKSIESSIDTLLAKSIQYRNSQSFREMLEFMARFRDYAPYNNMLVKIQNPSCSFFASERDWERRFNRKLIEDARPMLILAVMGPLMCVYDLDQTEGDRLPIDLLNFAKFEGCWSPSLMEKLIENAHNFGIQVDVKELSSTRAGFASSRARPPLKMRIAIHDGLDGPSQFGVLCHELAHIFLGHLGQDADRWWPPRVHLNHASVEVEAESVAFLVTERLGLRGSSDAYLGGLIQKDRLPQGVSLDHIARVAGLVERMALETVRPSRKRGAEVRR